MAQTYFTFRPDDHYGYVEIYSISQSSIEPPTEEDVIKRWVDADYSWDHDEEERDGEDCYEDWGYNDLYGNTYLMGHDGTSDNLVDSALDNFEGTENQMSNLMMQDLSLKDGVEFVICIPFWSGEEISMYIDGAKNTSGNKKIDVGGNVIETICNIILYKIGYGRFEEAADNFLAMRKINGVEDMLKSKITEEEYLKLEKIARGKGIASRFGLY